MHKALVYIALFAGLAVPAFASAATITNVTVNGGASVQVNPGDNIVVSVTATLGAKEKWKGTDWGINTTGATPTCSNTKNAHSNQDHDDYWNWGWSRGDWDDDHGRGDQDDRKHDNRTFTETFIAKAPKDAGLYGITVAADAKNRCGSPLSAAFTLPQSVRVGANTVPPTFAPYSDIVVQLLASTTGTTVTYPLPTATDHYGNGLPVSCAPVSGSFFATGNSTVLCNATDAWGNGASPLIFTVSVLLPPDVTPPAIAPHADISIPATGPSGATVTYTNPTAADDRDGAVAVICSPVSGSTFAVGTTTVSCTASDAAGNTATSHFNIGVWAPAVVVPADTQAPVIAPHDDIVVTLTHAADTSATVTYTNPTATDDHDGAVAVSCTPASGSTFTIGSTTVTCSAHDAANNVAHSTFVVGVYPFVPQPVVLASQPDESYLCGPDWASCSPTGGFTTDSVGSAVLTIDSAHLQDGALQSVAIALDPTYATATHPWIVSILCYTDAAHTHTCPDWVAGTVQNGNRTYLITEAANASTDNTHWTANFTNAGNEANFNGSSPVVFNPAYFYQLRLDDNGWTIPAYGSQSLMQPYWVMNGITQ